MDHQPSLFTDLARTIGAYLWVKGMESLTEKKESESEVLELTRLILALKLSSSLPWILGLPRKEDKK
ncbi:mechanosensitive ion channel protein MscL [Streptococcus timonensis]|uniref:mechanosensitive ion channel protein MscL n=1 Tax=Streptococcus timonensis TaxID=1852387 RepID=UPI0039C2B7B1